jgi:excisionase family DNA binding protein
MQSGFNWEPLIDEVANRVAAKVSAELATAAGHVVKPRLLTLEQAAIYIGRTLAAIQHMISEGRMPTVRSDRRVFVDIRDLDQWIEQNKQQVM